MTDAADIEKALTPAQRVVFEALRWANFSAGEGLGPVDGEDALAPDEFLMAYSDATGDEDWDTLAERLSRAVAAELKGER